MSQIREIVDQYLDYFPGDKNNLVQLTQQLITGEDIFSRRNFRGHIVANSLIIHHQHVLTVFHNTLQMYLQPGGHVDQSDQTVLAAALRETKEETGLSDLKLFDWHTQTNLPIFIESHFIPANTKKQENQHYHHDFMYAFSIDSPVVHLQLQEVSDFAWVSIDIVLHSSPDSFLSKSLNRMLELKLIKIS